MLKKKKNVPRMLKKWQSFGLTTRVYGSAVSEPKIAGHKPAPDKVSQEQQLKDGSELLQRGKDPVRLRAPPPEGGSNQRHAAQRAIRHRALHGQAERRGQVPHPVLVAQPHASQTARVKLPDGGQPRAWKQRQFVSEEQPGPWRPCRH